MMSFTMSQMQHEKLMRDAEREDRKVRMEDKQKKDEEREKREEVRASRESDRMFSLMQLMVMNSMGSHAATLPPPLPSTTGNNNSDDSGENVDGTVRQRQRG
jgi:hypothetical protein